MRKLVETCIAACAVVGGLSACAFSQDNTKAERGKVFAQLDKNDDGRITPDEVGGGQKKSFERLLRVGDKDKNGTLTRAEFDSALKPPAPVAGNPQNQGRRRGDRPQFDPRKFFKRFDRDGDGKLTLSELPEPIRPRLKPLFKRLKKDEITVEDLVQARRVPQRGQRSAEEDFKRLDRNGDGKLTKSELPEEAQRRFRSVFERLKKDEVTFKQYRQAVRRAFDPKAIFNRFDADKDGKLTLDEMPAPLRRRFKPLFERFGKEAVSQEEFTRGLGRRSKRPETDSKRKTDGKRKRKSNA